MTSKEFIRQEAKLLGKTVKKYKADMKDNYVIYVNSENPNQRGALQFDFSKGCPIVYGGIEDLIDDVMEGDIVMTEDDYVSNFMDLDEKPYFHNKSIVTMEYEGKTYQCLKFAYLLICFTKWGSTCFHHYYGNLKDAVAEGREMKKNDYAFSYVVHDWNDLIVKKG